MESGSENLYSCFTCGKYSKNFYNSWSATTIAYIVVSNIKLSPRMYICFISFYSIWHLCTMHNKVKCTFNDCFGNCALPSLILIYLNWIQLATYFAGRNKYKSTHQTTCYAPRVRCVELTFPLVLAFSRRHTIRRYWLVQFAEIWDSRGCIA